MGIFRGDCESSPHSGTDLLGGAWEKIDRSPHGAFWRPATYAPLGTA